MEYLEVDPDLDFQTFCDRVGDFADWLVECIETTALYGVQGWAEHLELYRWHGRGWRKNLAEREDLERRLGEGDPDAPAAVLAWGDMDDFSPEVTARCLQSLTLLPALNEGTWADASRVYARRIASTSKMYSTASLDEWAIFDSRVGIALSHAIRRWWSVVGEQRHRDVLLIRVPRAGLNVPFDRTPEEPFDLLNDGAALQGRLSFVYASWLLRCVAQRLSGRIAGPDGAAGWRLVHVEMVLFALGEDGARLAHELA